MTRLRTLLLLVIAVLLLSGTALLAAPPGDDFIRCGCSFCKANPDVECQISPDGYSILCADYARIHNC